MLNKDFLIDIFEKEKKVKFQNRVILGSVLVSLGLLGYFVT